MPNRMFFYAIQEGGEGGSIKFGLSENPNARVKQLQVGNAKPLQLLTAHTCCNGQVAERAIHKLFKEDLINGEWFHPSKKIMNFIYNIEYYSWQNYIEKHTKAEGV